MKRMTRMAIPVPGRMARIAMAGAVLAATSAVAADAVAAAGPLAVHVQLMYACRSPARTEASEVRITTTFPAVGSPGRLIRATPADVTVALGHAAVAGLTRLHATTVAGAATLSLAVAHNGVSRNAAWSGVTTAPIAVPAAGDMELSAAGAMPPAKVTTPGDVTFSAGDLAINLFLRQANGSSPNPATLSLACAPTAGDNTLLATVQVASPPGNKTSTPGNTSIAPRASTPARTAKAGKDWPKGCGQIRNINPTQQSRGCSYIAGFSDVNKLSGAAFLQSFPGFLNVAVGLFKLVNHTAISHSIGRLDYHGLAELPPAEATLLSFGFMPTTATMHLVQVDGFAHIVLKLRTIPPPTFTIQVSQELSLRISNVLVNGVTLNVGPDCRTVAPIHLVLEGGTPQFTNIFLGGPLSGTITIPQFTGCGVGENLDPIFNAAIAGPDNFAKITQGNLCEPPAAGFPAANCPPLRPKPIR